MPNQNSLPKWRKFTNRQTFDETYGWFHLLIFTLTYYIKLELLDTQAETLHRSRRPRETLSKRLLY